MWKNWVLKAILKDVKMHVYIGGGYSRTSSMEDKPECDAFRQVATG